MLDARYRYYCMYLKSRSWCNGRVQQHNSLTLWADHTIAPDTCAALPIHTRNTGYSVPTACGIIRRFFQQPSDFRGSPRGTRLFRFPANHRHVMIQVTRYGQLKIALIWCTTGATLNMCFCGPTMVTTTLPKVNLILSTIDGARGPQTTTTLGEK